MIKITDIKVGDKVLITSDMKLIDSWYLPERFAGTIQTVHSINLSNETFTVVGDTKGYLFGAEHIATIVSSPTITIEQLNVGDEVLITNDICKLNSFYLPPKFAGTKQIISKIEYPSFIVEGDPSSYYFDPSTVVTIVSTREERMVRHDNTIDETIGELNDIHERIHKILSILGVKHDR